MRTVAVRLIAILVLASSADKLLAGSATWKTSPMSNDWNTAVNWTPETIPSSETDVATFGFSNTTDVVCADSPDGIYAHTYVGDIVFNPGASAFTIAIQPSIDIAYPSLIEIHGRGIVNDSGQVQNFVAANSGYWHNSGRIYFFNSSSAGENVLITNQGGASTDGGDGIYGGFTSFEDTSSAAKATVINEGGEVSGAVGGFTDLYDSCSGEAATFISNAGQVAGAGSAWVLVQTLGNLGQSTFIGNPASVPDAEGGWIELDYAVCDGCRFVANGAAVAGAQGGQIYGYGGSGSASFTAKGGVGSGAEGGLVDLFNLPNSAQTVVLAANGRNGGLGGNILLEYEPVVDLAQFEVFGNGSLTLSLNISGTVIGSLAGNGSVSLGSYSLSIGNNNLSTVFSGVIQDSGRVVKVGTGTLSLSGANTYMGGTVVSAGVLRVANQTGSATGTGSVTVKGGTLGGKGTVSGAVTIGTGNGSGASLAPSVGATQPATLTLGDSLRCKGESSYTCKLNTNNGRADQVAAKGIAIESGAQFEFQPVGNRRLAAGSVFTVLNNTGSSAISGAFVNLPDQSTFRAGRNNYQVNYTGGDGNDLTLTIVP